MKFSQEKCFMIFPNLQIFFTFSYFYYKPSNIVWRSLCLPSSNTRNALPRLNSSCRGEGAYPTKKFQQSVLKRRARLSLAATTVRFNGSFQLQCQDLSQCWLDKIRKTFSNQKHSYWCSDSSTVFCLCAESARLPKLVKRKVAMLSVFTVGFLGVYESCLLFLAALPGLIDTLLHSC